ncbi:MAG: DUF4082 domain-containing protein [Mycobacteriales bacterium]
MAFTAAIAALVAGVVGATPVPRPRPHPAQAPAARPAAAASELAPTAGCAHTIWHDSDTPAATITTASPIELGVKFRADRDGYATGVRFYKGAGNTGTHLGRLWSNRGEKLAQATFTGESGSGWQTVSFNAPVRVSAGITYVASYTAPNGRYSYNYDYFASAGRVRSPLTGLKNGADGGNGVYLTGAGFPTSTYRSINYWVDVVFDSTSDDTCPATVWNDTDVPGAPTSSSASSVELGVKFRASRDGFIQGVRFYKGAGNTGTHVGRLWSRTGDKLAEVTFTAESGTGWQQAWFSQPVAISAGTTYVASYYAPNGHYAYGLNGFAAGVTRGPLTALQDGTDGGNGLFAYGTGGFPASSYQASNYLVDVMFTPAGPPACPCSVWPVTAEPGAQASIDTSLIEVGVRIRPLRDGWIKGVRFYKGTGNTGAHVGHLWTNTGTSLAQATFTNESSAGWQQVLFSNPVAVTAGTTYVASYTAPNGHYAYDDSYFAVDNVSRGPLVALGDGVGGANGVYKYGGGFPASSYLSSNYWVDVVYDTSANDTTAPVVVARTPGPDTGGILTGSTVTSRFSEPVVASSVSVTVSNAANAAVPGTVSYDATTNAAQFTPTAPLSYNTDYKVTVSGASDSAGNVMAPLTWTFTTVVDPNSGPGGPIGVITTAASTYSAYYAEILRAEGLNEFTVLPLDTVSAATLAPLDVAILGETPLTDEQVAVLTAWVSGGGHLIAMKPDPKLAGLLGLTSGTGTLSNAYLGIDPATPPGAGITDATMQFHGTADNYTLAGATTVAKLYSNATTATSNPAVTVRAIGSGYAAAFTYDLARSVALTRQGNPAWAGQERDGQDPIRSDDMFFGGTSAPDWVDLSKVSIPQADEQQRLLVNLVEYVNRNVKPLPKFWYLPGGADAVVVSTGDDEDPGTSGTSGRFDRYLANSPAGCSVDDWQCLRFTSFIWSSVALTDAQARAYHQQGFEVGLHPQSDCANWTPTTLENSYATQLAEWAQKYYDLPMPTTARYHCIAYSDWDSQPKTELRHGIRLDANYYYWPAAWVKDRPGFMTGSGIPMRFTDVNGRMIDVYQATTSMSNEAGQSYPFTINTLLDRALGPQGYYGVFTANMHDSNEPTSFEDDQLVASAQNHGVSVTTAREVLKFMDARAASSFSNLTWSGSALTFNLTAARTARRLVAALPTTGAGGTVLSTLSRDGTPVAVNRVTSKGIEYAMFPATGGAYTATYTVPAATVSAASVSPPAGADAATAAVVSWSSSTPATSEIAYGTSPSTLSTKVVAERSRAHAVRLHGLKAGTTYYYRVTSKDARGRDVEWPGPGQVGSFTTARKDTGAPAISGLKVTPLPDSTVRVSWNTSEPTTSRVAYGASAGKLDKEGRDDALVTSHLVVLAGLDAHTAYHLRISSADAAGNTASFPAAKAAPRKFTTAPAGVADQTRVGFRTGLESGALAVQGDGLAQLTLSRQGTGAFDSRVLDATTSVAWNQAVWDADVPAGARLTVSVRTGSTPVPDANWSAWTSVAGPNGLLAIPAGRYLQYHVEMAATAGAGVPVLRWIGFTHAGSLPGANRRAGHDVG